MRRRLLHFLRTRSSQLFGPWEVLSVNFTGAKKVIYMFPSYTLLSLFFSIFPASPSLSWAHHPSWRLNCPVSLPLFFCKSFLFLHYFTCYLCYAVATVSRSLPLSIINQRRLFSWCFKTVSNPLPNWQCLDHQGFKIVLNIFDSPSGPFRLKGLF